MKPINFEYQEVPGVGTVVALDAKLKDFDFQPYMNPNGKIEMKKAERTIKDCRYIDGCIYFHLGKVSDSVMVDLIEKFQKLKMEKGWKPSNGLVLPAQNLGI